MKNIKNDDAGYLLLRILFGVLLVYHGYGKLIAFTEKANVFADPLGACNFCRIYLWNIYNNRVKGKAYCNSRINYNGSRFFSYSCK